MKSEEYKGLLKRRDILGFGILEITLKELTARNEGQLVEEIQRILKNNLISKPPLHSKPQDSDTDYYSIDLANDQIEKIADIFFDLEVANVADNGDTTSMASFYGSLADTWNNVIINDEDQ